MKNKQEKEEKGWKDIALATLRAFLNDHPDWGSNGDEDIPSAFVVAHFPEEGSIIPRLRAEYLNDDRSPMIQMEELGGIASLAVHSGRIGPPAYVCLISNAFAVSSPSEKNGIKSISALVNTKEGDKYVVAIIREQAFDETKGVVPIMREAIFKVRDDSTLWSLYDNENVPDPTELFWDAYNRAFMMFDSNKVRSHDATVPYVVQEYINSLE